MMKSKIVISLGSIGMIIPSFGQALESEDKKIYKNEEKNFYENLTTSSEIINSIREIFSHDAFIVDQKEGTVYIDLLKLPSQIRSRLEQSQEVIEISESDLVKMDERFTYALARKNAFKEIGTYEGNFINQIVAENLKLRSTPILRDEMAEYLAANFLR